ncbi:MAG: HIT family protein [Chitinophagales bacterium]
MEKDKCIFCKIVRNELPNWKIWEDSKHIAFLTPYPNTKGFTVVVTKEHYDSYAFNLDDKVFLDLCLASKKVGKLLDSKLMTKRTGMIFEGMGINHIHSKLVPMHNIPDGEWKEIKSNAPEFFENYMGFISSKDGFKISNEELDEIQSIIKAP